MNNEHRTMNKSWNTLSLPIYDRNDINDLNDLNDSSPLYIFFDHLCMYFCSPLYVKTAWPNLRGVLTR